MEKRGDVREDLPTTSPTIRPSRLYEELVPRSTDPIAKLGDTGRYLEQNLTHAVLVRFPDWELRGQTLLHQMEFDLYSHIADEFESAGHYHWRNPLTDRRRTTPVHRRHGVRADIVCPGTGLDDRTFMVTLCTPRRLPAGAAEGLRSLGGMASRLFSLWKRQNRWDRYGTESRSPHMRAVVATPLGSRRPCACSDPCEAAPAWRVVTASGKPSAAISTRTEPWSG